MARTSLINSAADMKWLRDVHLPGLPAKYKSAVLHGNEDAPDRIEIYERRAPLVSEEAVVFEPDPRDDLVGEGVYRQVSGKSSRHHATMKKSKAAKLTTHAAAALGSHTLCGRADVPFPALVPFDLAHLATCKACRKVVGAMVRRDERVWNLRMQPTAPRQKRTNSVACDSFSPCHGNYACCIHAASTPGTMEHAKRHHATMKKSTKAQLDADIAEFLRTGGSVTGAHRPKGRKASEIEALSDEVEQAKAAVRSMYKTGNQAAMASATAGLGRKLRKLCTAVGTALGHTVGPASAGADLGDGPNTYECERCGAAGWCGGNGLLDTEPGGAIFREECQMKGKH